MFFDWAVKVLAGIEDVYSTGPLGFSPHPAKVFPAGGVKVLVLGVQAAVGLAHTVVGIFPDPPLLS